MKRMNVNPFQDSEHVISGQVFIWSIHLANHFAKYFASLNIWPRIWLIISKISFINFSYPHYFCCISRTMILRTNMSISWQRTYGQRFFSVQNHLINWEPSVYYRHTSKSCWHYTRKYGNEGWCNNSLKWFSIIQILFINMQFSFSKCYWIIDLLTDFMIFDQESLVYW